MFPANNPHLPQVRLVVRLLRHVADEPALALKGGTAINLFLRDLPRLSVDIDLAWLPVQEREASLAGIAAALRAVARRAGEALPGVRVRTQEAARGKLVAEQERARVTLEVNTVLRGSVYPAERRAATPAVEQMFGDVEAQMLSFEDLYAGKLVAALDRQHPRDLFDVKLLLEAEGISDKLFRAFLVYLISHDGSLARVVNPAPKPLKELFERQFAQMTAEPVSLDALESARADLLAALHERFGEREKEFLLSFKRGEPRWDLLGVAHAPDLPAVRWKLHNLERLGAARRREAVAELERVLANL